MRSEYSWVPPHDLATVSAPHQIAVSFTDHRQVVLDKEGRARRIDVRAGMVFATGAETWTWTDVAETTEALEIFPDRSLLVKFLTMCGMERAKSLLLASSSSVMEIAHRVGFSNVSHFRRTFRAHTGGLPSQLRSA